MEDWSSAVVIAVLCVVGSVLLLFMGKKEEGEDKSSGLAAEEKKGTTEPSSSTGSNDTRVMNPAIFKKFKLIKSVQISHNTKLLRFEIPGHKSLGLPIGRHISLMIHLDGNKVIRPYTPVSRPDEKGFFEILIKTYSLGKMSPFLFSLQEGSCVDIRGPVGRFKYAPNMYSHIGLVCAGTGLTPCLQVIRCVLEGEHASIERTRLTLVYQNRTKDDVLMRDTLMHLAEAHPDRLQVFYFLSNPPEGWGRESSGGEVAGYITQQFLHDALPPSQCDLVGLCGPSGFNDQIAAHLLAVGYDKDKNIYIW